MYFTNKKFTIEKEKLSIFNSLFSQYDEAKLGRISPKDARLILRELGIESLDAQKIVAKADPEKRSLIKYEIFVETLRIHLVRQAGGGGASLLPACLESCDNARGSRDESVGHSFLSRLQYLILFLFHRVKPKLNWK